MDFYEVGIGRWELCIDAHLVAHLADANRGADHVVGGILHKDGPTAVLRCLNDPHSRDPHSEIHG